MIFPGRFTKKVPLQYIAGKGAAAIPGKTNWYIEYTDSHSGCFFAVERYLYSGRTAYQRVEIADSAAYGRVLILDGKVQSSAFDEHIYHEALVHPVMTLHPGARRIMVIGGGEGAVLREILRYRRVERVLMVDIDERVVQLCREHLEQWHRGSFEDARVELCFMDARRCLEERAEQFDIIISDLTEPAEAGPSYLLFTRQFYGILKKRLRPGGALALQAGGLSPDYMDIHGALRNTLRCSFTGLRSYHTYIPSFDSAWGFIIASDDHDPLALDAAEVDRRLGKMERQLRFYSGETHEGMFRLPKNIRQALTENSTVIVDERPMAVE